MSTNSSTKDAADLTEASRTIEIHVDVDHANRILAGFNVPVPDAADLSEIRLIIEK